MKKLLAIIITALSVLAFYEEATSSLNAVTQIVLSLVLLFLYGMSMQKLLNLNGEKGILILSTERGKKSLDKLARWKPELWLALADFGMVMGFGALSLLIFKKISRRNFGVSLIILMLSTLFMQPYLLTTAMSIIQLPFNIYNVPVSASAQPTSTQILLSYAGFFLVALVGLVPIGVASFLGYGLLITWGIFTKLLSIVGSPAGNAEALSRLPAGAMPLLPGKNLPFFEGILAMALLLFFHEVSHGILARLEKIRVKNSGLVLFGFIPIGAFVEPDEKQLQKSDPEKQKNVLIAGSSANFILSILFFLLLIGYINILISTNPPIPASYFKDKVIVYDVAPNSSVYNLLKSGMVIEKWNGAKISTINDLRSAYNNTMPNETVNVTTDAGVFSFNLPQNRTIGIVALEVVNGGIPSWIADMSSQPGRWWVIFLYNFLGLTFVLNFLVGLVNLFPIPPFDGYRIISLVVKDKRLLKALAVVMIVFFIINLLPLAWQ